MHTTGTTLLICARGAWSGESVLLRQHGDPADVLSLTDWPVPEPGAGEEALHEEGRMLLYGSLTGLPMQVGDDPRYIRAGRRVLEVFWLGYWLPRLTAQGRRQLVDEVIALMRQGILWTSPGRKFSLDEFGAAVAQAESPGKRGKVLLVPAQSSGSIG
jgi:NADPH:quinone reductase-like Zn-dependent oxidoreductase